MRNLEITAYDIECSDLMDFGGPRRERVKDIYKTRNVDEYGRVTGKVSAYSRSGRHREFDINADVRVGREGK